MYTVLIEDGRFEARFSRDLVSGPSHSLLKVESGMAFVGDGEHVTVHPLTESQKANSEASVQRSETEPKSSQLDSESPSSPDPDKITVQDIERYEALMKGQAVSAISNA